MDGDHTAKSFEQGANSALKENEMTSGIHESVKQTVRVSESFLAWINALMRGEIQPAAGEKTTGTGTSMFSKDGALGSMFTGTKIPPQNIRGFLEHADTRYSRRSNWWHCTEDWWPARQARSHRPEFQRGWKDWRYGAGEFGK